MVGSPPALPVALSSSPPSDATGRRCSPHAGLAFLVHSPQTVENNLPPAIDDKPLARQKRRRTSKEDEDILKAEYLKNPKPDKTARLDIVAKVALGEKEVQIWFQNKRQNDRRRSRPLDYSSTSLLSSSDMSDPVTEDGCDVHEVENDGIEHQQEDATEPDVQPEAKLQTVEETVSKTEPDLPRTSDTAESQHTEESMTVPSTDPQTIETAPTELNSSQQTVPCSQGASQSHTSWISNRRSASFRYAEDCISESAVFPAPPPKTETKVEPTPSRPLKRTRSHVRLSMTAEGQARVVTDADKTPSPPRARPESGPAGLRRSYSATGLNDRLKLAADSRSGEPLPKVPKISPSGSAVGRSRNSRTWEFWCDPDTRNSRTLQARAEGEENGNAADAIGEMRRKSKILAQNQARQNAQALSHQSSAMVLGEQGVKKSRTLQRASTTHGRLQTKTKTKKGDSSESDELPQTESDKENWEPEVQQPQSRRPRPQQAPSASGHRQILGENTEIMSQSTSLGAMIEKEQGKRRGVSERGSSDPEQDEEVRAFMSGGRSSFDSAEEAGCVEGLLKLSQGHWR
ncbi:hypothetical protein EJ04DRAFT_467486 [Polyplosphaeria fusca]|uniref:Homeobox domain-containing protein n=1 Tax=Polyplosphaeria fusca TaxID=682080 RepID=A0A9P4QYQ9_9PLEO|nr:hypothetical protein EJ04DRAFT_467486 [Polyplosphaeria fusca]